jgi:opacity protein-like surface antigen
MKAWSSVVVAAAALVAGFGGPAAAQWYVSGSGMYVMVEDSDLTDSTLPGAKGTLSSDGGPGFTFAFGHAWANGFRAEIEGAYRRNDLDTMTITAFGLTATGAVGGDATVWSGMANAYYDFKTGSAFTPYIGAGAGVGNIDLDVTAGGASSSDSDTVFAYQFMGGVKYALTERVDLRVGYRYFALSDPQFGTTEGTYHSHNIEIGASFKF